MKIRRYQSLLFTFSLGVICLTQTGCAKNDVYVTVSSQTGKLALNPNTNDVIHFRSPKPGFGATFELLTPCKEGAPQTSASPGTNVTDCTVNVSTQSFARYLFTCTGCQDPEVIVGSDNERGPQLTGGGTARINVTIGMSCMGTPAAIAVLPATASQGQVVNWEALGNSQDPNYLKDWNVTFMGSNPCDGGTNPSSSGTRTCNVSQTAAGNTPPTAYAYTIASMECTSGSGTLSVTK